MSAIDDYLYQGPAITLNGGRIIHLQRLFQCLTYGHDTDSPPYGHDYQEIFHLHLKAVTDRHAGRPVRYLEPRLRPLPLPPAELEALRQRHRQEIARELAGHAADHDLLHTLRRKYPEPLSIGSVSCLGLFESDPIRDPDSPGSELFLLWFQDGFAPQIEPQALDQIKAIDWNRLAADIHLD